MAAVPVRLRNLTPHTVRLHLADGRISDVPPTPPGARRGVTRSVAGTADTDAGPVTITLTRLDADVTDLPDPEPGVWLIVSNRVAEARPDRTDLVFPDDAVRDPGTGQVTGCRALGRIETAGPVITA